jgi:hypothetical protein
MVSESVLNEVTVVLKARATAVLLAIALAASACASGTDTPETQATLEPGGHLFPEVDVVRLAGEETVNLASQLADGDQAVLLWFWAPH